MKSDVKKMQIEKLQVMQKIIEDMEEDFFNTESTAEFLRRTNERVEALIITDF